MDFPKSFKRALAIAGIASGLSGVSLAAGQPRTASLEKPDATVDVAKVPIRFNPHSGENEKNIMPIMMEAADKVCHVKHLFGEDQVSVEATNDVRPNLSRSIVTTCDEAHLKGHPRGGR
jgi:hypothetical protein